MLSLICRVALHVTFRAHAAADCVIIVLTEHRPVMEFKWTRSALARLSIWRREVATVRTIAGQG